MPFMHISDTTSNILDILAEQAQKELEEGRLVLSSVPERAYLENKQGEQVPFVTYSCGCHELSEVQAAANYVINHIKSVIKPNDVLACRQKITIYKDTKINKYIVRCRVAFCSPEWLQTYDPTDEINS